METLNPPVETGRRLQIWLRIRTQNQHIEPDTDLVTTLDEQILHQASLRRFDERQKTQFIDLPDGRQAITKNADGTVESKGHHMERAAYLASRIIGLDIVPPTVLRTRRQRDLSLQLCVDGQTAEQRNYSLSGYEDTLAAMAVFDTAIWNPDRNGGNFIVSEAKLWAIDNERAFRLGGAYQWLHRNTERELGQPIPENINELFVGAVREQKKLRALHEHIGPLVGPDNMLAFAARLATIATMLDNDGKVVPINFDGTVR